MQTFFNNFFRQIQALFFESDCAFALYHYECNRESQYHCTNCIKEFAGFYEEEREDFQNIEQAYSISKYHGLALELIHSLKWHNPKIARPIASLMYELYKENNILMPDLIIAVPSYCSEERNWAPGRLIAKELALLFKINTPLELLNKTQKTELYKLSKKERREILKEKVYILNKDYNFNTLAKSSTAELNILLIDDLIASGLSLESCASLIKEVLPKSQIIAYTFCSSRQLPQ